MKRIVGYSEESEFNKSIGGKAKNLQTLVKLGFNVPNWVVIPQEVLLNQLKGLEPSKLNQENLPELKVEPKFLEEIAQFFGASFEEETYAVRSSAIDEDGANHSFAGQFESYLHVPAKDLSGRIKDVWKSAFSDRVLSYRKENKLPPGLGIAVIVQRMVNSEVSGVAFGANPISGSLKSKVINAVFGLGEGLVSGALNADSYTIDKEGIDENLSLKTEQFVKDSDKGGVKIIPVPKKLQTESSLSPTELQEISRILDELGEKLGSPQDIEFAIEGSKISLTQTRPITTLSKPEGEYIVWDNSNIIESYPGITTPLTYSFILKMYDRVYRQFAGLMGVSKKTIELHADVFANTLGLVRGRVYYNLLNWYKMLAMLPGYSINAENMERMMGVKERFELDEEYSMTKGLARIRLLFMLIKMLLIHFQLPGRRRRFIKHLNRVMTHYHKIDFEVLSAPEIIRQYRIFEESLLLKWKAPLINDFFAMIWFGLLEKQSKKVCPREPNLHNDLLCGSQDIISVAPIHQSMAIAKMISENQEAKDFFQTKSEDAIWMSMQAGSHPEIKIAIDQYLNTFGDRCIGELKLESYSYKQKPERFIKLIQTYVNQGITIKKQGRGLEDDIRENAESKVRQALHNMPFKRWVFSFILNRTRDLVSNRENLRFERTRGFGMVRNMMNALGKIWHKEGFLADSRDIFYLELEEILNLEKASWPPELQQVIESRKSAFAAFRKEPIPKERFYTYGYSFKDEYIYSSEKLEAAQNDLQGIGCCPGIVEGKVKVVMDPNELDSLNGDILVTSSTDPGWVTLFPTASAIIVERGSLLSHSAIVSREMGIPCIVSVNGLLRSLKTGDKVKMDGSSGVIKRIEDG